MQHNNTLSTGSVFMWARWGLACYKKNHSGFVDLSVHTANGLSPVPSPFSVSQCLLLNYPSFLSQQGPSQITPHCALPIGLSSYGSKFQSAAHCTHSLGQAGPISSGANWLCDPDRFLPCQQDQCHVGTHTITGVWEQEIPRWKSVSSLDSMASQRSHLWVALKFRMEWLIDEDWYTAQKHETHKTFYWMFKCLQTYALAPPPIALIIESSPIHVHFSFWMN